MGTWAGTGDYGIGFNRRVGSVTAPEVDTRTPTQRAADFHLAAHDSFQARKKAEEEAVIERQRKRQLAEKAEADRRAAMKLAEFTENMIDAELAEFSPQERGQIWMTLVDQKRGCDIEYAQYLALALRTSKAHALKQQNEQAREERLKYLRNRHQYCWMLIEKYCRDRNLPDTLESYEQAITDLKLEE